MVIPGVIKFLPSFTEFYLVLRGARLVYTGGRGLGGAERERKRGDGGDG